MQENSNPNRQDPRHTRSSSYSRSSGRRHHSSRSKQIRNLWIVNILLFIVLVVVFIFWIQTWVNANTSESERFKLASELREKTQLLDEVRKQALDASSSLTELVNKRLPGLSELAFDTTLQITNSYVRNLTFTVTGVGDKQQYEYRLVIDNQTGDALFPNIEIMLFDKQGIQTGYVKIAKESASSNKDLEFLEPHEIRAYNGPIPIYRNSKPEYFLIQTH